MRCTYVVSDLHGHYDLFLKLLKEIELTSDDVLYILGDVIDRGEDSIKLLRYIRNQPNITMLLGNHEDMMYRATMNNEDESMWLYSGGKETLLEMDVLDVHVDDVIEMFVDAPLYVHIEVGHRTFYLAHASLKFDNGRLCEDQDKEKVLWHCYFGKNDYKLKENEFAIFGHVRSDYVLFQSDESNKKYNGHVFRVNSAYYIDGSHWLSKDKPMNALRLNDLKEFNVYI